MTDAERAIREDVAIVERVPRAVFSLTGARPLAYLHDVLAQDVADLPPGRGAVSAVLTANGRVAAEVRVVPLGDTVLIDAEEAAHEGIMSHVVRHAGLAGVDVQDVSERYAVTAVRGPNADAALSAAELPIPPSDEAAFERIGETVVVRVVWGVPGVDLITPAGGASIAVAGPRITLEELDAARIDAGRPRFGADLSEDLLVNETPLLRHGVSMSKGCYPGQESVARVHNLGRIRRALRSLRSRTPLPAGAEVLLDGGVVGRVTSAAAVPSGGAAIGVLAATIAPGATVRIDGTEVIVEELP